VDDLCVDGRTVIVFDRRPTELVTLTLSLDSSAKLQSSRVSLYGLCERALLAAMTPESASEVIGYLIYTDQCDVVRLCRQWLMENFKKVVEDGVLLDPKYPHEVKQLILQDVADYVTWSQKNPAIHLSE